MHQTYKQPEKEHIRQKMWQRAISYLTEERISVQVLTERYIQRLWDYCFYDYLIKYDFIESADDGFLDSWVGFAASQYGTRSPEDLRIAFFSGPEPENDLRILTDLGIRIENVWAFENNNKTYRQALDIARKRYPTLKLFSGPAERFFEINTTTFDIIYLDFTSPLFSRRQKPYTTLHAVFEKQALSDLAVLVTNTCLPDQSEENLDFLTAYYAHQPFVEGPVIGESKSEDKESTAFFVGADSYGYDYQELKNIVGENWFEAYSAFCTQYPMTFASLVQPVHRILSVGKVRHQFFTRDETKIEEAMNKASDIGWLIDRMRNRRSEQPSSEMRPSVGGDLLLTPSEYPLWHFMHYLKNGKTRLGNSWHSHYSSGSKGATRLDAVYLGDLMQSIVEGYSIILSDNLKQALPRIHQSLPDLKTRIFCDIPFPHLWLQLAINQLGVPYHPNVEAHWRTSYTAKVRTMLVDLFVFDRCRALYDWIPMPDLYEEDLVKMERQIVIRSCLDAISKQVRWIIPKLYSGANLICVDEKNWARFAELSQRSVVDSPVNSSHNR